MKIILEQYIQLFTIPNPPQLQTSKNIINNQQLQTTSIYKPPTHQNTHHPKSNSQENVQVGRLPVQVRLRNSTAQRTLPSTPSQTDRQL
jgi:hypothetical protein